jgi:urease gamma subunit
VSEEVHLHRAEGVLSRYAGRGILLAHPEGTGVEWLSPSASVVWDVLVEPRTQDELVDDVAGIVGQDPDQVRDGVRMLISRLRVRGLVIDEPRSVTGQRDKARS